MRTRNEVQDALAGSISGEIVTDAVVDVFCNRINRLENGESRVEIDLRSKEATRAGLHRISIDCRQLGEKLGLNIHNGGGGNYVNPNQKKPTSSRGLKKQRQEFQS